MKNSLIIFLFVYSSKLCAQPVNPDIRGVWELQPSEGIFKIYADSMKTYNLSDNGDGSFFVDYDIYGFYENCSPPHLDSLRTTGTGKFFFQVSLYGLDIKEGGVLNQRVLKCFSIEIDSYDDGTFLRFGRSSLTVYKKVKTLPETLVTYLKQEQPDVYRAYEELLK